MPHYHNYDYYYNLSINPTCTTIYRVYDVPLMYRVNRTKRNYMSYKTSKRIEKIYNWLFTVSSWKTVFCREDSVRYKFKLNMITLTLSSKQKHDDKYIIKHMLEPYLRMLRNKCKGLLYVWKAEVQDNGNIHFHINTNVFIHYNTVRSYWNKIQRKNKYISGDNEPNSTDIKAIKNKEGLSKYMSKYISKKDVYKKVLQRYFRRYREILKREATPVFHLPKRYFEFIKRPLKCKLWDCSNVLKKVSVTVEMIDNEVIEDIGAVLIKAECIDYDFMKVYCNVSVNDYKGTKTHGKIMERLRPLLQIDNETIKYNEI